MRAECYLTSNGRFARADQLRSINNRRRKRREKKKRSKITFPEPAGSARMNPAQLPRKDQVGVRRVALGHHETFKAARER